MRLARFDAGAGAELGIVDGGVIVALSRVAPAVGADMRSLIADWSWREAEVRRFALEAERVPLEAVRLLAPIARPGKIMAIGLNYADHIAESGMAQPEHQVWFMKAATAVNGPFDPIKLPGPDPRVDYEAELVVVIGAGGRRLSRDAAKRAVFGWCVGNDVTERAWQHRTPQWSLGKSFDSHAPFGPWITTTDDLQDPHGLNIRAFVNGEARQSSNTTHLVFDVWDQVAHLSQAMTLEPGDLLFTGTPGGVGAAMKPMRFLAPGDCVRIEIAGLGAIENCCEAER